MYLKQGKTPNLPIIGSTTFVSIEGISGIPAKVDTGADSSSVHVENIEMLPDGSLSFSLISAKNPKILTRDYRVAVVRSSNGDEEIRYHAPLSLELGGQHIRATFSLSNRSSNNFPVLIGRRTIKGKFLVDVSLSEIQRKKHPKTRSLNSELRQDPLKFHRKYIKNKSDK